LPVGLREVITAGEALRVTRHLVEFFQHLPNCSLQNQYGPSETHVVTAYTLSGKPEDWPALPPIGRPLPNVRVAILDETGHPVAPGAEGELHIGGVALARGYLGRPDLTEQRFVPEEAGDLRARRYRTGDLVRQRPDG
jgi:non-ribosomal peptide synthetase component F